MENRIEQEQVNVSNQIDQMENFLAEVLFEMIQARVEEKLQPGNYNVSDGKTLNEYIT